MSVAALALIAMASTTAYAVTINVDTTIDDLIDNANCTLREAIQAANTNATVDGCAAGAAGMDTINIPAGTYTTTIAGAGEDLNQTGDFDILEAVDVVGAGSTTTIINGGAIDRVLHVVNAVTVNVSRVTLQNGSASSGSLGGGIYNNGTLAFTNSIISGNMTVGPGDGGGIWNNGVLTVTNSTIIGNTSNSGAGGGILNNSGTVTVTNSTVSGNSAVGSHAGGIYNNPGSTLTVTRSTISGNSSTAGGGGIFNNGDLTVANSTVSGNSADGGWCGGGIYSSGTLTATNSTITNNSPSAGQSGGGICNASGTVNLKNTIVANQTAGSDCSGGIATTLNDLDSDGSCGAATTADPLLDPLASNGGPTFTHALQALSPAIDAGDANTCANSPISGIDQRSFLRPQGPECDIGAFEYAALPVLIFGDGFESGNTDAWSAVVP